MALAGEGNPSTASSLPLDGKNVLPFLLGQVEQIPDNLYLFFDAQYLQTARMGRWKIHVARWNIPRYTAASGQQKNITLRAPELYDMTTDVGESYNLAADHPQVFRDLQARIAAILRTFPEEIKAANAELLQPPQS
jgi:hypothetical protein